MKPNLNLGLSVIVPVYNSVAILPELVERLEVVLVKIGMPFELIFVNDGSLDNSGDCLDRLARTFSFVRVVHLSRNFGQHLALTCGYRFARGRVVGMMNVDLQEHPDQIPLLIQKMSTEIVTSCSD